MTKKPIPTDQRFRSELDLSMVDWSRVDATTDAEIVRQAAEDEDTAPDQGRRHTRFRASR